MQFNIQDNPVGGSLLAGYTVMITDAAHLICQLQTQFKTADENIKSPPGDKSDFQK